jgi:hypothetical protein
MLGLVLFTQGIVAVNACASFSPARAYSMDQHDDAAMHCHEDSTPNSNACLSHCTQFDQISVDQHQMPPMAPPVMIGRISVQPGANHIPRAFSQDRLALNTGPPIPILFCSLLN